VGETFVTAGPTPRLGDGPVQRQDLDLRPACAQRLGSTSRACSARATSARRTGLPSSAWTSDSATARGGTMSAAMPPARSACAVPGPIAAIAGPRRSRRHGSTRAAGARR